MYCHKSWYIHFCLIQGYFGRPSLFMLMMAPKENTVYVAVKNIYHKRCFSGHLTQQELLTQHCYQTFAYLFIFLAI